MVFLTDPDELGTHSTKGHLKTNLNAWCVLDSRQLDESDYRSKTSDNVLRFWNSTLQILLPVAALAVIWGRRGLLTRFFMQFDKNCISVLCPSFKDKQYLLEWINYYISSKLFWKKDSADNPPIDFWKNGSLICTLINSAIPGACPNPQRHWQRPPSHGQALAYKYLGITPIFTDRELTLKYLTEQQKIMLEKYVNELRRAVAKVSSHDFKFSSAYIAKGMGLVSGEQFRKMYFYIYLNTPASFGSRDIVLSIRAPHDTYQTLTIPSYMNASTAKQNIGNNFLRSLSVDLGSFINSEKKNEPSVKIPITFTIENDRIKIIYVPQHSGIYEISIITNGFHLLGSPFPVSILENTSNIIDNLTETEFVGTTKKIVTKKVVSEVIDCVDKKIVKNAPVLKTSRLTHTTITEEDDENLENDYDISSICNSHIENEINTNLQPFLNLDENQEKGEDDTDCSSQTTDEFNTKESTLRKELQILPKIITKIIAHKKANNDNCSLSVCQYLSLLKLDDQNPIVSYYKDFWQSKLFSESSQALSGSVITSCKEFKDVLQFWESHSALNFTEKSIEFRKRRSLPNLHTVISTTDESSEIVWKQVYVTKKRIKTMHNRCGYSLPNIYANVEKHDFIQVKVGDYMEGLKFRNKFRRRLNYWERISSTSSSTDTLSIRDSSDETDSGVGHCESPHHNDFLCNFLASGNLTFKEKQHYWEKISSSIRTQDLPKANTVIAKSDTNEVVKAKQTLLESTENLSKSKYNQSHTFDEDFEYNLTDDWKSMQNYRERMKMKFNKNKEFFKSLENLR